MPLELRHAALGDAPDLTRLILELGYDTDEAAMRRRLDRVLGSSGHVVFVAIEPPHGIVGCIHVSVRVTLLERPYAEIEALSVTGGHRRQGVGQALVQRAHQWATRRGILDVVARSQLHRKGARDFYRTLGYRELKEQRVFVRNIDAPPPVEETTEGD